MALETYEDADAHRIYYDLDTEVPKTGGTGDLRGVWSKTIRSVARNFYGFLKLGTAGRIPIGYTDLDGKNFYRSMEVIGDANLQADGTLTVNNGAITGAKIAANTITAANIEPGAIDGTLLGINSVTNENMANNAIDTNELVNGAVTREKIELEAIGTNELEDACVTPEKLSKEYIEIVAANAAVNGAFTAGQIKAILTIAANVGLTVKQAAAQTGNLIEVLDSAGDPFWVVNANGEIDFMNVQVENMTITNLHADNVYLTDTTLNGGKITKGDTFPGSPNDGDKHEYRKKVSGIWYKNDFEFDSDLGEWVSCSSFPLNSNVRNLADPPMFPFPHINEPGIKGHYVEGITWVYEGDGSDLDIANHVELIARAYRSCPTEANYNNLTLTPVGTNNNLFAGDGEKNYKSLRYNALLLPVVIDVDTTEHYNQVQVTYDFIGAPGYPRNDAMTLTVRLIGGNV